MTNDVSGARARRLRTWSRLGNLGRVPTEYEIVTHGMNYTTTLQTPLEAGPHTFGNRWIAEHRDAVAVRVASWDGFRDPDEITYRKYNKRQDAAEAFIDHALEDYGERRDIDRGHSARWLDALGVLLTPQRYPVHGLQMLAAYVAQMAPSSYITNAAAFQAADELRRVQRIAYRTKQLDLAHPARGFGRTERGTFETHERWQGAREAIERLLVAFDWDEAFTALELAIKPAYDEIFLRQLAEVCRRAGDELDALILDSLWQDAERARRWSTALVRFALAQGDNCAAFERHLTHWRPFARKVLRDGAALLAAHSDGDPSAIVEAGEHALGELHARAGLDAGRPSGEHQ
jgi:toluene monooxygenase system protein E